MLILNQARSGSIKFDLCLLRNVLSVSPCCSVEELLISRYVRL